MRAAATLLIHILTARTSLRFPRKRKARKSVVTRTLRSLSLSLSLTLALYPSLAPALAPVFPSLYFLFLSLCFSPVTLFALCLFFSCSHTYAHTFSLSFQTCQLLGLEAVPVPGQGPAGIGVQFQCMCTVRVRLRLTERRGRKETGGAGGGLLWSKDT